MQVLFWFTACIANIILTLPDWASLSSLPGWTILLSVEVPVLLTILAAIFVKPRKGKTAIIFISTIGFFAMCFVTATLVIVAITSIIIP